VGKGKVVGTLYVLSQRLRCCCVIYIYILRTWSSTCSCRCCCDGGVIAKRGLRVVG